MSRAGRVFERNGGSQFSIECYWKPEPAARIHDTGARNVGEAVHALIDLAWGDTFRWGREVRQAVYRGNEQT